MSQTNYTEYTIEGSLSLLLIIMGYKIYKMRCDTRSKCCDDNIEIELHNKGNKSIELIQSQL